MQPEISPRCPSCGASYRKPAMFCPECGKPLTRHGPGDNASRNAGPPIATDGLIMVDASWTGPELTANETQPAPLPEAQPAPLPIERAVEPEVALPIKAAVEPDRVKPVQAAPLNSGDKTGQTTEPGSRPRPRERTRERLHRASSVASSVARGALEDNVKRVEKIHHVSTAMLEEATYDPSLRFVLVAIGLFIVFVILLVLSKVMG